jgi:endonuclease-3
LSSGSSGVSPGSAFVREVLDFFDRLYPQPRCGLEFHDPFELLAATILSAQCTDKRVNQVTPALFEAFGDPQALAAAPLEAVEELIKTCGLYKVKAKNLKATAAALVRDYGGRVPDSLEELVKLPGVGRKTANVVLGDAFGIPGLTVDTHLGRVSRRLALSRHSDAAKVEKDLMVVIPKERWTSFSHQAINHGRNLCRARNPLCSDCSLPGCPSREAVFEA